VRGRYRLQVKILVHINSQLGRSRAAIKLAAGFLVSGQLCVINVIHSVASFINSPALLHVI